ncbi:MAG: hypothetical protein M3422_16285 [Actinomycetota bacterium]|nr:hypothetical protein [Actinomycetota bacterium]
MDTLGGEISGTSTKSPSDEVVVVTTGASPDDVSSVVVVVVVVSVVVVVVSAVVVVSSCATATPPKATMPALSTPARKIVRTDLRRRDDKDNDSPNLVMDGWKIHGSESTFSQACQGKTVIENA